MKHEAEVVVTGYSLLTPIGCTVEEFGKSLFSGKSGVKDSRQSGWGNDPPVPYTARIDSPILDEVPLISRTIKATQMLAQQICDSMEAPLSFDAIICGVRDFSIYDETIRAYKQNSLPPNVIATLETEAPMKAAAEILSSRGHTLPPPSRQICKINTCVTGNIIIGEAFHRIRAGDWKRVLVFTTEVDPNLVQITGLSLLGALATENVAPESASRPYSLGRSGFVKGEAGAIMILESRSEAEKRGAKSLGEVVGFCASSDAWQLTIGREDCRGAIAAMNGALKDAKLSIEKINYINGHGTSTPQGDALECAAIKGVFGKRAYDIPISSLKSQIGHSTVACGMVEAIATLLMLDAQEAAATINFQGGDPQCDLDFVPNNSRKLAMEYAMSCNYAFGGQNACLILKKSS